MRSFSDAIINSLSKSAITLARGFILTRGDGQKFYFCDHDREIAVNEHSFTPIKALDAGYGEIVSGLSNDSNNVLGGFEIDAINEQDVICGKWDNAEIEIIIFDWQNPAAFHSIFKGFINTINQTDNEFEFEIGGIKTLLENQIGRVFSRNCDAVLGDEKCGINLENSAYNFTSQIIAYGINNVAVALPMQTIDVDKFVYGKALFSDGILDNYQSNIKAISDEGTSLIVTFDKNLPLIPEEVETGQMLKCYMGCDKLFTTCKSRFSNGDNFRGCPHMPGQSDAFAGPTVAGNDGGSRDE